MPNFADFVEAHQCNAKIATHHQKLIELVNDCRNLARKKRLDSRAIAE
jgi:hypothetical protein